MIQSGMATAGDFVAELIDQSSAALAEHAVVLQLERSPGLREHFGPRSPECLTGDTRMRLAFLADAIALDEPEVFVGQIVWTRGALDARRVPVAHLRDNLLVMIELLSERTPSNVAGPAVAIVREGLRALDRPPVTIPSAIEGQGDLQRLARAYLLAMLEADRAGARDLLVAAAHAGTPVLDLYEHVIQPAHFEIGRMWYLGEITVAEEHYTTAAAEWALPQLSRLVAAPAPRDRTIVATTVDGDFHSFGARVVSDCFELDGWRTYFLGASTPAPDVVQAIFDQKADLLGISASLGCHLRALRAMIAHIRAEPEVGSTPILVGGEPFNRMPDLWRKVGADGSARNATEAVALGNRLAANHASG